MCICVYMYIGKQECGGNRGKVFKNVSHPLYPEYLKEVVSNTSATH